MSPGADPHQRAVEQLRARADPAWPQMRGRALRTARRAFRPSTPVRGRHALGTFALASDVLVAALRTAVESVPGIRVRALRCRTGPDDVLLAVDLSVSAAMGTALPTAAAAVRAAVRAALPAVLGPPGPDDPAVRIDVGVDDVHEAAPW